MLSLTPHTLATAYKFLNSTPPFREWNLPEASDVLFTVVRDPTLRGWYKRIKGKHVIGISSNVIGHTNSLMLVMAHEMIHVYEAHVGICTRGEHSAAFRKLAQRVCDVHGFDPKLF